MFVEPSYVALIQKAALSSIIAAGLKSRLTMTVYGVIWSYAMNTVKMAATIQTLQAMLVFPDKHEQYAKILETVQDL